MGLPTVHVSIFSSPLGPPGYQAPPLTTFLRPLWLADFRSAEQEDINLLSGYLLAPLVSCFSETLRTVDFHQAAVRSWGRSLLTFCWSQGLQFFCEAIGLRPHVAAARSAPWHSAVRRRYKVKFHAQVATRSRCGEMIHRAPTT